MNLTPLRKRALSLLDQRGEMPGQQFAYELLDKAWKNPQGAQRWAGGYLHPLVEAGFLRKRYDGWRNCYSVTKEGREALRTI